MKEVYYVRDIENLVHVGKFQAFPLTLFCGRGRELNFPGEGEDAFDSNVPTCLWCAVQWC